jgi:hypothetical protein
MKIVRKAAIDDAEAVHRMLLDIEWISDSVRTDAGLVKIRDYCKKGEVWVVDLDGEVVSTMFLRLDSLSGSLGHKVLLIPILTTVQQHRCNGYAKLLIRQAKDEAMKIGGILEGHPKNDMSINLLRAEKFELIEDNQDNNGNDLFRWPS